MTHEHSKPAAHDVVCMARALSLATRVRNGCDPNPRVGCIIEKDGEVIAQGWHKKAGSAHAEIVALDQAGAAASGSTVYVTLEPCSHSGRTGPCVDALIAAGVHRVVAAMQDPNPQVSGNGFNALRNAGIIVETDLMSAEAASINRGFVSRMQRGRPFVCSKIAASMDGRTALQNGASQWITSPESREDVQQLRASASAILTGIGTVTTDNPRLTVRIDGDDSWQQPQRVIVDSDLRTPVDSHIVAAGTMIFSSIDKNDSRADALRDKKIKLETVSRTDQGLNLQEVMARLGQLGCNDLLVEAGSVLNGALLQAGLLDEIILYQAPHVLGPHARPMFGLPELTDMAQRYSFHLQSSRCIGNDWRLRLVPTRES